MPRPADPALREPELARQAEAYRRAALRAEELAGGMTDRQARWRPGPDRWSVAECLEHLVRTGEAYLRVIDPAIDEGREAGTLGEGPFRHGLLDRWLVRFLEPPPRLGIPAPRVIDPRRAPSAAEGSGETTGSGRAGAARGGARTGGELAGARDGRGTGDSRDGAGTADVPPDAGPPLPRFLALQDRLLKRLGRAEGLDLAGIRLSSPFFSFLRMDLGTAFAVVAAHQRRHLWQAERVAEEEGFP